MEITFLFLITFNPGTCSDKVNGFSCTCQSGFTGVRCETNINDCPPSICGNGKCYRLERQVKGQLDLLLNWFVPSTC